MQSPGTPFSLCVITKDEEARISRCLASVPFATDVVVLDSGSGDRTVELAARAGARTFVEPFRGHVLQKARAVELARHDWVLCLDADEELSPELAAEIARALAAAAAPGGPNGFSLARKTWYAGRFIEHSGWWPEWRLRLFNRRCGGWTGSDPHDRVEVSGTTARLDGALWHYAYRDLEHHLEKVNRYTTTMARGMAAAGTRFGWSDVLFRPAARFVRMYFLRRGFLDGGRGFVLATIGAFYVFLKYAKLWERTRAGGEPPSGATSGS